jgi:uncharacterized protein YicC (UPF0701 family)
MPILIREDIRLLKLEAKLKAELKNIKARLRPKINRVIRGGGVDCEVRVGSDVVHIKRTPVSVADWKTIAYAVASEDEILEIKPLYTKVSKRDLVEVL